MKVTGLMALTKENFVNHALHAATVFPILMPNFESHQIIAAAQWPSLTFISRNHWPGHCDYLPILRGANNSEC
jgi:hypothetical protein